MFPRVARCWRSKSATGGGEFGGFGAEADPEGAVALGHVGELETADAADGLGVEKEKDRGEP